MSLAHTATPPALGGGRWNTFPETGVLTARAFFDATLPLLQGIIDDNALTGADGDVLQDQIRATLGLNTRETSLPLSVGADSGTAARELGAQADAVGREIAAWAGAALDDLLAEPIAFPAGPLVVRSHCYGHVLTPAAADLLRGSRGGPVTMQLYNEWLHQMVLLRDALLPFTNWQDVPLLVTPGGLRHIEAARDRFLTELLVRQVRHAGVVGFARHVVTGAPGPDGYGFDAPGGTALPAVLDAPVLSAPRYLLTWRPDPASRETATYVTRVRDYYAEPRTRVEELASGATEPEALAARVVADPAEDGVRHARIEVAGAGTTARADLGQALRGHRFAARDQGVSADRRAGLWAALRAPGLVWTRDGDTVVDAVGQPALVVLALLGRLYPENVVLSTAGPAPVAERPHGGGSSPSRLIVRLPGDAGESD